MGYYTLMYIHLATVVPCIFIGAFLLSAKKGSTIHKSWGKIYMSLMTFTAVVTLFMPALVGPTILNHFGYIHLFSLLTLVSIPRALYAIIKGNVRSHKISLWMPYVGAIVIAGGFTLVPGRFLHNFFFG